MDKKLKMRRNVILYMFTMLAVLMGCFFYAPKEVKAAEPQGAQISAQVQSVAYSSDIPEEVKKPIEKGKNLNRLYNSCDRVHSFGRRLVDGGYSLVRTSE